MTSSRKGTSSPSSNCQQLDLNGARGPWTPRFEALFKKAGMTLEDAANKIAVPGDRGPHPQAYHEAVFQRLSNATEGLSRSAYTSALQAELTAG